MTSASDLRPCPSAFPCRLKHDNSSTQLCDPCRSACKTVGALLDFLGTSSTSFLYNFFGFSHVTDVLGTPFEPTRLALESLSVGDDSDSKPSPRMWPLFKIQDLTHFRIAPFTTPVDQETETDVYDDWQARGRAAALAAGKISFII
jgi:hypothetical protein